MIKWLDVMDQNEVSALAESCQVTLDSRLLEFLEKFAEIVEKVSRTRRERIRATALARKDLRTVNEVVRREVGRLRRNLFAGGFHTNFFALRHVETCLPVVHLLLDGLPELVIHVNRSYGIQERGIAFGFRAHAYCGGRLTGAVAQAANYLTVKCRAAQWQLSVSDVVNIWCTQAEQISPEERMAAQHPPGRVFECRERRQGRVSRRRTNPEVTEDPQPSEVPEPMESPSTAAKPVQMNESVAYGKEDLRNLDQATEQSRQGDVRPEEDVRPLKEGDSVYDDNLRSPYEGFRIPRKGDGSTVVALDTAEAERGLEEAGNGRLTEGLEEDGKAPVHGTGNNESALRCTNDDRLKQTLPTTHKDGTVGKQQPNPNANKVTSAEKQTDPTEDLSEHELEAMYAEQVRAIRKKRKAIPLDDYELAWKKHRLLNGTEPRPVALDHGTSTEQRQADHSEVEAPSPHQPSVLRAEDGVALREKRTTQHETAGALEQTEDICEMDVTTTNDPGKASLGYHPTDTQGGMTQARTDPSRTPMDIDSSAVEWNTSSENRPMECRAPSQACLPTLDSTGANYSSPKSRSTDVEESVGAMESPTTSPRAPVEPPEPPEPSVVETNATDSDFDSPHFEITFSGPPAEVLPKPDGTDNDAVPPEVLAQELAKSKPADMQDTTPNRKIFETGDESLPVQLQSSHAGAGAGASNPDMNRREAASDEDAATRDIAAANSVMVSDLGTANEANLTKGSYTRQTSLTALIRGSGKDISEEAEAVDVDQHGRSQSDDLKNLEGLVQPDHDIICSDNTEDRAADSIVDELEHIQRQTKDSSGSQKQAVNSPFDDLDELVENEPEAKSPSLGGVNAAAEKHKPSTEKKLRNVSEAPSVERLAASSANVQSAQFASREPANETPAKERKNESSLLSRLDMGGRRPPEIARSFTSGGGKEVTVASDFDDLYPVALSEPSSSKDLSSVFDGDSE